jgi:hypothetical protein
VIYESYKGEYFVPPVSEYWESNRQKFPGINNPQEFNKKIVKRLFKELKFGKITKKSIKDYEIAAFLNFNSNDLMQFAERITRKFGYKIWDKKGIYNNLFSLEYIFRGTVKQRIEGNKKCITGPNGEIEIYNGMRIIVKSDRINTLYKFVEGLKKLNIDPDKVEKLVICLSQLDNQTEKSMQELWDFLPYLKKFKLHGTRITCFPECQYNYGLLDLSGNEELENLKSITFGYHTSSINVCGCRLTEESKQVLIKIPIRYKIRDYIAKILLFAKSIFDRHSIPNFVGASVKRSFLGACSMMSLGAVNIIIGNKDLDFIWTGTIGVCKTSFVTFLAFVAGKAILSELAHCCFVRHQPLRVIFDKNNE